MKKTRNVKIKTGNTRQITGNGLTCFIKQLKNLKMYQKPWFLLWPGSSHVETLTPRVMVLGGGILATSS